MTSAILEPSPTLASKELASRDPERYPLTGFGEVAFPLAELFPLGPELVEGAGAYAPVLGLAATREAAAAYFAARHGRPCAPDRVVVTPGSKTFLHGLMTVVPGDVVVPVPAWPTYLAQARLLGRQVVAVPLDPADGYQPRAAALRGAVREARRRGADPRLLILNTPCNPTGVVYERQAVAAACEVAREEGLLVVSDEIYAELAFAETEFTSPFTFLPGQTAVATSLSKWAGCGGWRAGFARLPEGPRGTELATRLEAVGGATWTCCSVPAQRLIAALVGRADQAAAVQALSADVHAFVAGQVLAVLDEFGVSCVRPGGAFYLYPDLAPVAGLLRRRTGADDGRALEAHLFEAYSLPVLAGYHFGEPPSSLRVRLALGQLLRLDSGQLSALLQVPRGSRAAMLRALPERSATHLSAVCASLRRLLEDADGPAGGGRG